MVTKEHLHELVDQLPECNWPMAERVLLRLNGDVSSLVEALARAPVDDEPLSPDEEASLLRTREDLAAGRGIPHEELRRRLGL